MKKLSLLYLVITVLFIVSSCQKSTVNITATNETPQLIPYDYMGKMESDGLDVSHFTGINNNPMSNDKINLGRVIFYDKKLSLNNSISCNSCHLQEFAFGDRFAKSFGFEDRITGRNSPTIQNLGTSRAFFWDMSQSSLEEQVVIPFLNHIEMGIPDLDYLVQKARSFPYYNELFINAFPEDPNNPEPINKLRLSKALAQFVKSITTTNSKFDNLDHSQHSLNAQETMGKDLFLASCNNCHQVINSNFISSDTSIFFSNSIYTGGNSGGSFNSANIGLDEISLDQGAGDGRFKIPTLRNLLFSAPYMHDGRFETLDEVIEHYNSGVVATKHLDFRLRKSNNLQNVVPRRLHLDEIEKEALKAFLLSLTDTEFVTEEMYSDPFKY